MNQKYFCSLTMLFRAYGWLLLGGLCIFYLIVFYESFEIDLSSLTIWRRQWVFEFDRWKRIIQVTVKFTVFSSFAFMVSNFFSIIEKGVNKKQIEKTNRWVMVTVIGFALIDVIQLWKWISNLYLGLFENNLNRLGYIFGLTLSHPPGLYILFAIAIVALYRRFISLAQFESEVI